MEKETQAVVDFLTQYADNSSDEGVYEAVEAWLKRTGIDEDVFQEVIGKMTEMSDRVNTTIYKHLMMFKTEEELNKLGDLIDAIDEEDLESVGDFVEDYDDFLQENNINTPDFWYEIADIDLKQNGMDARSLYWCNDVDYDYKYQKLNAYENGFTDMDNSDVIEYILDEKLEEMLKRIYED